MGGGYGESKWTTETILNVASQKTALRPVAVRVGQVCANRVGYWNEREWFPSIVKTALFQKCLPDTAGVSHRKLEYRIPLTVVTGGLVDSVLRRNCSHCSNAQLAVSDAAPRPPSSCRLDGHDPTTCKNS